MKPVFAHFILVDVRIFKGGEGVGLLFSGLIANIWIHMLPESVRKTPRAERIGKALSEQMELKQTIIKCQLTSA